MRREILAEGVVSHKRWVKPCMMPQDCVTIYGLSDPLTGDVRYVGKTWYRPERRLTYHLTHSKKSRLASGNWIRSLVNKGLRPVLFEIEKVELDADWQSREKHWIAHYRNAGARLLNHTDGGDGLHGRKVAGTAHAARISQALRRGEWKSCETCSARFWRKPRDIRDGNDRFCSRTCYAESRRGVSRPVGREFTERGVRAAAKLRRERTHCKRGHPLSGENVFRTSNGARGCKECRKLHKLTYCAKGGK